MVHCLAFGQVGDWGQAYRLAPRMQVLSTQKEESCTRPSVNSCSGQGRLRALAGVLEHWRTPDQVPAVWEPARSGTGAPGRRRSWRLDACALLRIRREKSWMPSVDKWVSEQFQIPEGRERRRSSLPSAPLQFQVPREKVEGPGCEASP